MDVPKAMCIINSRLPVYADSVRHGGHNYSIISKYQVCQQCALSMLRVFHAFLKFIRTKCRYTALTSQSVAIRKGSSPRQKILTVDSRETRPLGGNARRLGWLFLKIGKRCNYTESFLQSIDSCPSQSPRILLPLLFALKHHILKRT